MMVRDFSDWLITWSARVIRVLIDIVYMTPYFYLEHYSSFDNHSSFFFYAKLSMFVPLLTVMSFLNFSAY